MSIARVRALAIVSVLVICAAIVVSVTILHDRQRANPNASCPSGAATANLKLPGERDVKINVMDASGGTVAAGSLTTELQHRGFQLYQPDPTAGAGAPPTGTLTKVALLRFGPKAVGRAWLIQAYFLSSADEEFEVSRKDDGVDVIVGSGFKKLATVSEVKQALAQRGRPTPPPGTCSD